MSAEWSVTADCGSKCFSQKCVAELNAIITKCALHQIKAYVRGHCPSSAIRQDDLGRFPIHIAASCGRIDVLDWLITNFHCDINKKDKESGWTALHRAVYYGRLACAVLLIECGANMWLRDKEGFTPMDIAMLDCAPWVKCTSFSRSTYQMPSFLRNADPSEVYMWGVNDNYVLGHWNLKGSRLPEPVEFFTKKNIELKQVVIAKFHSVFVAVSGSVYACGIGEGGRLGCGHQEACLEPAEVSLNSGVAVSSAAAGTNHTVFVTENGQLLVCGLNRHHVLGIHSTTGRELVPIRVQGALKQLHVVACAAAELHTVVWTGNGAIYTFGTNAGQLGHAKGDLYIKQPRQVSAVYNEDDPIVCVHACDSATIVATKQGTVYLMQNYMCRKIIVKQLNIEQVQVGGGRLHYTVLPQVDQRLHASHFRLKNDDIHVIIRKESGTILLWTKSHGTLDTCKFNLRQSFLIKDVAICGHGHTALLVMNTGQAYLARFGNWTAPIPPKRGSESSTAKGFDSCLDMLDADAVQELLMEQVSCAFRAYAGALGPDGKCAALLQCKPINFLTDLPAIGESTLSHDVRKLFEDRVEKHGTHDLIVTATDRNGNRLMSMKCHKYILASRSPCLRKILGTDNDHEDDYDKETKPTLIFENCDPNILSNALEFMYCQTCQLLSNGFKLQLLAQGTCSNDITIYWSEEPSARSEKVGSTTESGNTGGYAAHRSNSSKQIAKKVPGMKLTGSAKNALSEFKLLAKKLGLHSSQFDSVIVQNGVINTNVNSFSTRWKYPPFAIQKLQLFCDIRLTCSDGVTVKAHKCLLVARVEFFRSMLLSSWNEKSTCTYNVPIPSKVFKHVLEFIYTGSNSLLCNISSLDVLCEIMGAADLLLLNRLKEISEARVASLLTLKNVSSIMEFAFVFHCHQLCKSCQQFICQNFPALLHTPHFYSVEYETLEKSEDCYRSNISGVFMRCITPSSEGLELLIDEVSDECTKNVFESYGLTKNFSTSSTAGSTFKQRTRQSQGRRKSTGNRKKSAPYGIFISELLSNEKNVDSIVDQIVSTVRDSSANCQSTVNKNISHDSLITERNENVISDAARHRLDYVVTESKNKVSHTTKKSLSSVIAKRDGNVTCDTREVIIPASLPVERTTPVTSVTSFKDIMAEERVLSKESGRTPLRTSESSLVICQNPSRVGSIVPLVSWGATTTICPSSSGCAISLKSKRLSQKQRKKLEQQLVQIKSVGGDPNKASCNAWGSATSLNSRHEKSFWEVMKEQSASTDSPMITKAISPGKQRTVATDNGPWQFSPDRHHRGLSHCQASDRQSLSFRDIMQTELHETEWQTKRKNKPMHLIQMEDKAMAELKARYEKGIPAIEGQYFTAERVKRLSAYCS